MLQGEYESMLLINQFGFHITTFNGKLAQDNTWTDTWEEFYVRGMRRMLRPLETGGRRIEPVLHGDLWTGNVATQDATGEPLMFDSSAFWGHHECRSFPLSLALPNIGSVFSSDFQNDDLVSR